ncbi:MAG TPA: A/G-specific adenine glycosylase [Planctomycetota bacterium]|nr:A/G-specific adenine glycosylase [Planctomycetota bacterium]
MPFAPSLLRWFHRVARALPWRRTRDPYAIWVSEVMLQQTQIATVLPYYERWMRRFPDVRALAKAPLDDVLKAWEGLGYYARARHLHAAARHVVESGFPKTREDWESLPGVGPYTSAAIASIAHDERTPVRDGNVRRVVSRLLKSNDLAKIDACLERTIPASAPGDFNQALMELGQRVCVPRSPKCPGCPVASHCAARKAGVQDRYPRKVARKPVPTYKVGVGLCFKDGRVLVSKRAPEGLLGGLWEFPGGKRERGESYERTVKREFLEEVGLKVDVGDRLVTVPHRYSHFAVELHAYLCRWKRGKARTGKWVKPEELDRLAFPAANRRILEALRSRLDA